MKQFAKLFETERGQILVLRQDDDCGQPEVRFFFDPNTEPLGVCSVALKFPDSDAGDAAANKTFAAAGIEGVKSVVFEQMDKMSAMFADAGA